MTARPRITLTRSLDASLEDVWALWTTQEGFESWWGPEGFRVEVRSLDRRPDGELRYAMIAVAEPMIEFMKRAGMPIVTETRIRFREIVARERLSYVNRIDFVPGVEAYDTETVVALEPAENGVKMTITLDPMHNEEWTQRAVGGWGSQLGKLAVVFARRKA